MKAFKFICGIALLLVAQTLQAQGILVVRQETRDGKTSSHQIQMDKTHMRTEAQSSEEHTAFVFDGTAQVARMINLDKKTYNEITRAQLEQMRQQMAGATEQMSAAQKQMEERMKNMPPEQRAIVEQMMRGRGGRGLPAPASQPLRPTYRQAGSDKVGPWSCTKYDAMRGDEKVEELCTVDPKEIGLVPGDFDVAKQFAEFMKVLVPLSADQVVMFGSLEDQGFSGLPVRRISYANGKVSSVSEVKEVRRQSFPASTFEVPAGFTKQNMGARP